MVVTWWIAAFLCSVYLSVKMDSNEKSIAGVLVCAFSPQTSVSLTDDSGKIIRRRKCYVLDSEIVCLKTFQVKFMVLQLRLI